MTAPERKFRGVWIPADLWLDRTLSVTEKVMLVEIDSLESDDRGCYKSNSQFAEFFDLSSSRVSEIISKLAEKGVITINQIREGNRVVERQIRIVRVFEKPNTPYSEKAENLFGKHCEGYSEKAEESNTRSKPKRTPLDEEFEEAWNLYPKREGGSSKKAARKAWDARIREGITAETMIAGVKRYAKEMQDANNIGTRYVKQASTFLGPDHHFQAAQAELIQRDASPDDEAWWTRAGFGNQWDAMNAGCTERNSALWRDGRPTRRLAGANVEPWPEVSV